MTLKKFVTYEGVDYIRADYVLPALVMVGGRFTLYRFDEIPNRVCVTLADGLRYLREDVKRGGKSSVALIAELEAYREGEKC